MDFRYKALLIEDEVSMSYYTEKILEINGFDVICANNARDAELMARSHCPDVILLDLGLPDSDGMSVLSDVRSWSHLPVIVISARADDHAKISALENGADDYIVKPFVRQELIARINVALRHHGNDADRGCDNVVIGGLTVDFTRHRVLVDGSDAELTQSEFRIVALLAQYAGMVITYDEMMVRLWGPNSTGGNQILRVNMTNIRRKLERDPSHPRYIFTENGVGYRMALPEEV
ncbi:MAG TPA: DNA-binding response regulator [Ruminococcaceae bacterium]|nr:DNA-binding response regulator [Oscillospiraceae bacterium]HBJ24666.1 DNA-binding response regulator [Oscillospiraceae bacterium]